MKRVRVKVDGAAVVARALTYAIERGMNRHDKYIADGKQLDETSRQLLTSEIINSFSIALADQDAEIR